MKSETVYAFDGLGISGNRFSLVLDSRALSGRYTHYMIEDLAVFSDPRAHFDLFFYPPIAVLIVDTMHSVRTRLI